MSMDLQRFQSASFQTREAEIKVPELAEFFDGKKTPVWKVRGLTGAELGRANEASERGIDNIRAMVKAMAGEGDKATAIQQALGVGGDDVPADVSRRIELLTLGSVDPALGPENRDVAVRLAETFPTTFYNLTNRILSLTGQGAELGKPKRSGKTAASG